MDANVKHGKEKLEQGEAVVLDWQCCPAGGWKQNDQLQQCYVKNDIIIKSETLSVSNDHLISRLSMLCESVLC